MSRLDYNPFDFPDPELNAEPITPSSNEGRTGQNKHPVTGAQSNHSGPNIARPNSTRRTAAAVSSEVKQLCQELKNHFTELSAKVKNLNLFNGAQWSAVGRSLNRLCDKIAYGTFDEVKSAAKNLGNEIKALFRQKTTPQSVVQNVGDIFRRVTEELDRAGDLNDVGRAMGHMFTGLGEVAGNAAHDANVTLRHRIE
ncbi:MAG: hypothetical protein LBF43_02340 [Puniceicoccales bacterium]|nr:hypothetical protein [Puniceicoccales bacterium]